MRLWLSKPIYELLPYFYLASGMLLLAASLYLDFWYWPGICLGVGFFSLIAGLVVWLKRRDHRQGRSVPMSGDLDVGEFDDS